LNIVRKPESLFDYKIEDFSIEGYEPHGALAGAVAV
jgi:thymidylate synthase